MRELVDAFWNKLFFGAEPRPLMALILAEPPTVPFSVVGAGRKCRHTQLLSPESIKEALKHESFIKNNEEAIGWIVADLQKLGLHLAT